ncbi:MAG: PilZ domain-containing protein [Candidatus Scalindua sp.]
MGDKENKIDRYFVCSEGEVDEYSADKERCRHVRFPVSIAIKHGEGMCYVFQDFVLNISKGSVFIKTDNEIPKGFRIAMHFYIPPEVKLIGEFEGEVVEADLNDLNYTGGFYVKFIDHSDDELKRLEEFLEEKRHLLDKKV